MRRREFIAIVGGAVAWPFAARAQPSAIPVIGFPSTRAPEESADLVEAFRSGLNERGFVDGQNAAIEFRWAHGDYGHLPALAFGSDPVKVGLVESFNRPGGNVTGVTTSTNLMEPKRLALLREFAPGAAVVGALVNPKFPAATLQAKDIEEAARAVGQRIIFANASADAELDAVFESLTSAGIGALMVTADPYLDTRGIELSRSRRGSACPQSTNFGNLLSRAEY